MGWSLANAHIDLPFHGHADGGQGVHGRQPEAEFRALRAEDSPTVTAVVLNDAKPPTSAPRVFDSGAKHKNDQPPR